MVSIAATNPDLSNKKQFPNFARVAPTDAMKALALAANLRQFGFTRAFFFCSAESFGQGAALAFASAFQSVGGTVEKTLCMSPDEADAQAVGAALKDGAGTTINIVVACPADHVEGCHSRPAALHAQGVYVLRARRQYPRVVHRGDDH
jgi:ABC-type branched-subunit amino acid transport system substrate-binding protein